MGREFGELTAFIDGSSLGNPGHAGAGVVFFDSAQREVKTLSIYQGEITNNVAEYRALILALEKARDLGVRRLTIFSDSELLVRQFNGQYKVRNAGLRPHFEKAKKLQQEFEVLEISHVPREKNQRADQLARQAAFRRSLSQEEESSTAMPGELLSGVFSLDEVSLLPEWSDVLPEQVKTEIVVAGSIRLGFPLLSAPVASAEPVSFATAVALRGGMAILRPSRLPGDQVAAVKKVKAARKKGVGPDKGESGSIFSSRDEQGKFRVGGLVHPAEDLLDRCAALVEVGVDLVVLEASLGHGPELIKGIAQIKGKFPDLSLIAGDVTDPCGARQILESGADGIKIGAPFILGLKVPLFTAIRNCARLVEEHGGTLVADVGTAELMVASSLITRAIGAGAHIAMVSFQPAGKVWQAQILAEGLDNLGDDLRMIMSCCGARSVEDLRRRAKFIRVRGGGGV